MHRFLFNFFLYTFIQSIFSHKQPYRITMSTNLRCMSILRSIMKNLYHGFNIEIGLNSLHELVSTKYVIEILLDVNARKINFVIEV